MLLVGEAVGPQRREEQLAAELRQNHANEGAGTGSDIVWTEPTQLDLVGEVSLDEVQDLGDEWTAHRLGDPGTPDQFRGEQAHEARDAWAISRRQVGPRELRQYLLGRTVEQRCGIEHHAQDRQGPAQDGPKKGLLCGKGTVKERTGTEPRPLCS